LGQGVQEQTAKALVALAIQQASMTTVTTAAEFGTAAVAEPVAPPAAPNRLLPTSGAWSAQVAVSAQKHHQQEECLSVLPLARGCLVRILEASRFQAPHEC